jgi:hypothetical protein
MEPRGLYRERNGWGNQHSARVKYDEHQELDLPEDRYRERGYQPPFNCFNEAAAVLPRMRWVRRARGGIASASSDAVARRNSAEMA